VARSRGIDRAVLGIGLDDLLRIAGDPNDQQGDWAIRALAEAVGEKAASLPPVRKGMRSRPELVERVLTKAEKATPAGAFLAAFGRLSVS